MIDAVVWIHHLAVSVCPCTASYMTASWPVDADACFPQVPMINCRQILLSVPTKRSVLLGNIS